MPTVFCACGEQYQVVEQHIGRRIQCGRCGRRFEITRPQESQRGDDPRRSQQREAYREPREASRGDPYRNAASRDDPYRDAYRGGGDSYRGGDGNRGDAYRGDGYRGDAYRGDGYRDDYRRGGDPEFEERDDEYEKGYKGKLQQMGGFFTPQVRLILFIAFAGLALMAAAIMISTLKPAGPTSPAGVSEEG